MKLARSLVASARPKQWVKNALVLAAPGAAGILDERSAVLTALAAVGAFVLASAGTYFWNDVLDFEADREHPTKRYRPVAAGRVPLGVARASGALLLAAALAVAAAIRWQFLLVVGIYVVLTLLYSSVCKHIPVIDLVLVASGFLLRAIGGAVAVDVPMSRWFLLTTSFGSLFIVAGKRFAELRELGEDAFRHRATLEEYSLAFLQTVLTVAVGATMITYCIWAFEAKDRWATRWPFLELSIVPMVIAVLRYLLVLEQGRGSAPEEIFAKDRVLQLMGLIWVITFGLGIYAR